MSTKKKVTTLKIKLARGGAGNRTVYMQVIEQPSTSIDFTASNRINLRSEANPELSMGRVVFLRGYDKSRDNDIVELKLGTEDRARKYFDDIVNAVTEYNKSLTTPPLSWATIG